MLKITNLDKSFGKQKIFDNVNFNINPGERIGLVGRNGHGKTTLLRIITKTDVPDSGEIVFPKHYSIGYIKQELNFTRNTIIDEGCLGLSENHKDEKWRVEKILFGLGFVKHDMARHPSEFSGGYQVRLNLAKVLVSEPNLLLLDEPTNFLDVVSIRWLSNFLKQWKNELVLITHDRGFMDGVISHTLGIHRKKIKKIKGSTDKFYEQILKEEEIHENTRMNDDKKRKDSELFISRFRAKARLAGLVQSRIKALEKQEKLDKLEKIKTLDFSFSYEPYPGKVAMSVHGLTFSYDKNMPPLINDLSFSIGRGDRICVVGKNGKGKTTLLRLLSNELTPDKGEMSTHPGTKIGYFAQTNTINLNKALSIEEEIMNVKCDRQKARDICGGMLFEGDVALKKIDVLSGGEKSRVLLGKILALPSNLLLLDEPTNHLDMESCDAFMAAVDDFEGAAILVTHSEMFLQALANRFIVFQNDGITVFDGSYQSFLEKIGWEDEEQSPKNKETKDNNLNIKNKKDLRKIRADILTRRSKIIKPIETKITLVEETIESLEKKAAALNREMIDASEQGNGNKISGLSKETHKAQSEIESLYNELDILTIEYDKKSISFDKEMEEVAALAEESTSNQS